MIISLNMYVFSLVTLGPFDPLACVMALNFIVNLIMVCISDVHAYHDEILMINYPVFDHDVMVRAAGGGCGRKCF